MKKRNNSIRLRKGRTMEEERVCAICGETLSEDEKGHILKDERLVCDGCFEYNCASCDDCGEYLEEDDLEYWGDDYRLCPECFELYFPSYDRKKNLEETSKAYAAMKKRLIGKKTNQNESGTVCIETDMNDESFKYRIEVTISDDGRISDISRYSVSRCRAIWVTGEDWRDYPVEADDYAENGPAEDLIRSEIEVIEE